jgi:myo-inositol 2-dehydrogenase/D-chiro-inositol 1-dehydrogenase
VSGTDRVRIALVGAGRMGRVHLKALRISDAIEVAGVVEPVATARQAAAADGTPVYESVDHLLDDGALDGVLIAAPSDQHARLVSRFAAARVPMLCEKPLGVTVHDAATASHVAQHAGVLLQVGYWRRFVPELRALRERISAGEFGEVIQLNCMQWDAQPPSSEFRGHSGGIAVDMGVHEFDQTRWLLGQEFAWVAALPAGPTSAASAPRSDPDNATILAQLSGGAAATVSLGRHFPHADSCWLEIWGTHGYERVPFLWDADVWSPASDHVFVSAMVLQAESFARAVRGGVREGAGGEDAITAQTVAAQVAESLAAAPGRKPQAAAVTP